MLYLPGTDCHISNSIPFQSSTNKRFRSRKFWFFLILLRCKWNQAVRNMNNHGREKNLLVNTILWWQRSLVIKNTSCPPSKAVLHQSYIFLQSWTVKVNWVGLKYDICFGESRVAETQVTQDLIPSLVSQACTEPLRKTSEVEANTPRQTGTEPLLNPLWVWIRAAAGHKVRCAGEADANGCSFDQAKAHASLPGCWQALTSDLTLSLSLVTQV